MRSEKEKRSAKEKQKKTEGKRRRKRKRENINKSQSRHKRNKGKENKGGNLKGEVIAAKNVAWPSTAKKTHKTRRGQRLQTQTPPKPHPTPRGHKPNRGKGGRLAVGRSNSPSHSGKKGGQQMTDSVLFCGKRKGIVAWGDILEGVGYRRRGWKGDAQGGYANDVKWWGAGGGGGEGLGGWGGGLCRGGF